MCGSGTLGSPPTHTPPLEAQSAQGAPDLSEEQTDNTIGRNGDCGPPGTKAHPTLRIRSRRSLTRELQGPRVGLSRAPPEQHHNHLAPGRPPPGMLSARVRTPRAPWQGGAGMSPG